MTTGNVAGNDRAALIFLDFAHGERLKLLGHMRAFDVADRPDLALRLALDGYRARVERFAVVTVEGVGWNCPQHITPRFTIDEIATISRREKSVCV